VLFEVPDTTKTTTDRKTTATTVCVLGGCEPIARGLDRYVIVSRGCEMGVA